MIITVLAIGAKVSLSVSGMTVAGANESLHWPVFRPLEGPPGLAIIRRALSVIELGANARKGEAGSVPGVLARAAPPCLYLLTL